MRFRVYNFTNCLSKALLNNPQYSYYGYWGYVFLISCHRPLFYTKTLYEEAFIYATNRFTDQRF